MENTNEKNLRVLDSEDMDKVSAGSGEPGKLKCDMCGWPAVKGTRVVIPFQGGHVCTDCLKKAEEDLGRKLL